MTRCDMYHLCVVCFAMLFSMFNLARYSRIYLSMRNTASFLLALFSVTISTLSVIQFSICVYRHSLEAHSLELATRNMVDMQSIILLIVSSIQSIVLIIRPKWLRLQRKEDRNGKTQIK